MSPAEPDPSDTPTEVTRDPTQPAPPPKRRRGRGWRRVGCGALVAFGLVGVALCGAGGWLLTPSGQSRITREVEGLVTGFMAEGSLKIGDLSTNLYSWVEVRDVALLDGQGRAVASVPRARATVDLMALVSLTVRVPTLDIEGLDADLQLDEEGNLDVVRLFATPADPDAPPFEGLPVDLLFEQISLTGGRVRLSGPGLDPIEIDQLTLGAAFEGRGLRYDVRDLSLQGQVVSPQPGPLEVDGGLVWQGSGLEQVDLRATLRDNDVEIAGFARDLGTSGEDVDLQVQVARLDLPDVDAFVKAGLTGRVGGSVTARGTLAELAVAAELVGQGDTRGRVDLDGTVDLDKLDYQGRLGVEGLRVDDLLQSLTDALPVTAHAEVSGSGAAWPDDVQVQARLLDGATELMGVKVERLQAGLALADGVVQIQDLDVAGPVGQITGSGSYDLVQGGLHLELHGERIDPRHLRGLSVPVELDGTLATVDAVVDMPTFADEVSVDVEGTAVVSPLLWTRDIRARRATGDYQVRLRGTDVRVDANASATGLLAYGTQVAAVSSRGIVIEVGDDGMNGSGGIEASDLVYPLIPDSLINDLGRGAEVERGSGAWTVEVPAGDDALVAVDADVDVEGHRLLRYPGQSGAVRFAMLGDDVDIDASLEATSTRRLLDTHVDLDLSTLTFSFPTLQLAPEDRQTWTARPGGGFRVQGSGVTELDLSLLSARGELNVAGQVGLDGEQDLELTVYDLDLLAVARLLPMWLDGLEGYAGGVVELGGTAQSPTLTGDVEVVDVGYLMDTEDGPWQVVQGLGARVALDGAGGRMQATGRVGVDGTPLSDLDVVVPVQLAFDRAGLDPRGKVSADVLLLEGGLRRFGELLNIPLPDGGTLSSQLALSGTLVAPTGRLTMDAQVPVDGLDDLVDVSLRLDKRAEGALSWRGVVREGDQDRLRLNGDGVTRVDEVIAWSLEGGQEPNWDHPTLWVSGLHTTAILEGLPIRSLTQVAGVDVDADGTLSGEIALGGSAYQPRLDGAIRLDGGRAANVRIENTELVVTSSDQGYHVALSADLEQDLGRMRTESLGAVNIEGEIPLVVDFTKEVVDWERGPMDVRVSAGVPLALASAYDPGVREAMGSIELQGHVTGSVFNPEPTAHFTASDGAALTYRPMGVRFRDIVFDTSVSQKAIRVERIAAETRSGRVRVDTAISGALSGAVEGGEGAVKGLRRLFQRRKSSDKKKRRKDRDQGPTGRGRLEVTGQARLDAWNVDQIDLRLEMDQALLASSSENVLRLSTTKPLTVRGDLAEPRVRGSVRVDEANLFLDYASAVGGSTQKLDNRITVHRGGVSSSTEVAEASVFDDVDADLFLDLGRATRGRLVMPLEAIQWLGAQAEALLKVDVRARLASDDALRMQLVPCRARGPADRMVPVAGRAGSCGLYHPQVRGVVDIVDGTAAVLRAKFGLSDSRVSFVGNEVYNPNLDIHGVMEATDTTITLDITGTAYEPDIQFDSPDNPDQIFATLALGTSLDGLTAQQVASALAFAVLNSALSDVNLPSVNIDPSGKVQVGLVLARSAFVTLTAGGTPRPDENVFEAELEYTLDAIMKGLLLKAGYGAYAIPFWGDVLIERRFD